MAMGLFVKDHKNICKKLKKSIDSSWQVWYYTVSKGEQYKINLIDIGVVRLGKEAAMGVLDRQEWYVDTMPGMWPNILY